MQVSRPGTYVRGRAHSTAVRGLSYNLFNPIFIFSPFPGDLVVAQPCRPGGVGLERKRGAMKIGYKYFTASLMSLALANGWSCFQASCRSAEQTPVALAERIRVLEAEDLGLLPSEQAHSFFSRIGAEAGRAGLIIRSTSKANWRTNQLFTEVQQTLNVQATEPQLLEFLRNVAASNSSLRVRSLWVSPTPERNCLQATVAVVGNYRLPAAGPSAEADAAQTEYLVLSQRRHLRQAALDCYTLTKSTLPPGWQLDNLSLREGKRLSAQGQAPAEQVSLLEDVRAKLEKAQAEDGKDLFVPSSGDATMRMRTPGLTNFSWSMQFELRPPAAQ